MKFYLNYLFVLIWLAYMITTGVLLFSRGFLLSRVSKTDISSCRRLSTNPDDEYFLNEEIVHEIFKDVNASSNLCLPTKSKVIILVIDALKYEFGVYDEQLKSPLPYQNKLTILHEVLKDEPEHARLMRFKADAPTTTLQRLKGMTTGSLPTFIDIGSNFASSEINEDNIIDQMINNNLSVVFMGDGTWTDLYPRRFMRAYSYPSFDIFDLDTVDSNIEKYLPKEMNKNDWQVLIAHFLGVDHCGHKYGPLHQEMSRKLSEMNEVISDVIDKMDNDTTLFVMGDHGMTATGDHGGDSADETNALLFAYTKRHKFISSEFGSDNETLQQIDLVPTLATILGIPIPYSNLGLINFNIIPDVIVPHMSKFQVLLLHAWQNAQQIYDYFYNYALENKRTFNVDEMGKMETEFILLTHRVKSIYNEAAFKSFIGDMNLHLRQILQTCRDIWVKFDPLQMLQGLLIVCLFVFFGFLLLNNSMAVEFYKIFNTKSVAYTYLLNFAAGVFGYRYYANISLKNEEHAIIFCTNFVNIFILVFYTINNWRNIIENWTNCKSFANLPTRIIFLTMLSIYFSNSFIIQEPKILLYLLVCIIGLSVYELLVKSVRSDFKTKFKIQNFITSAAFRLLLASILSIIFVRFSYMLFRCREEQGNCTDFSTIDSSFSIKSPASGKMYIIAVLAIILYSALIRIYLRSCGNLTGNAVNVILVRYGPTLAAICVGGHMLTASAVNKNIKRSHIDKMAQIVYGLLVLQILTVIISPLMTHVITPKSNKSFTVTTTYGNVIPQIFRRIKQIYEGDDEEQRSYDIPVVYGLATIYSSVIIAFGSFLSLMLLILLEPRATIGFIICLLVAATLLSLHAILRYRTATNFDTCIQPTFTALVSWFLLAHFCFFATSHQTTLSQIDWRAAFIGRSTTIGQNNFISGILVILNTFCGQIFFFCLFGLLSTETFSIFALFPNLIKSNFNRGNRVLDPRYNTNQRTLSDISNEIVGVDMTRGELVLYENSFAFLGTIFRVATQFFMLQAIKIFCAMLSCTIHCRHLMVWKIFAPRFIYEALATFVSLPAIIIGFLLIIRVHTALDKLITKIDKSK